MLGATTKHYKTYGKHKTNVINKRVVLDNNKRLSPLATSINNKVQPGRWSDSSDDEEVEVVPIVRRKPITLEKKVVPKATMRRSIEMVEQDKENSSPASSTSTVKSAKSKGKVPGVLVLESTEESSDSLKRLPLRRKSAKKVPVRSKFSRVVESEAELSDRPIVEEEEEVAEETSDVVILEKRITEIFLDDTDEPVPTDDDEVEILSPTIPISTPSLSILPFPSALSPLLKVTLSPDSTAPFDFTSFVSCPLCPFSVPSTVTNPWRKVGEASYSEVFSTVSTAGEEIVIKIIPIASPAQEDEEGREQVEELPFLSEWEAVKREIEISNLLGAEDGGVQGFVPFKGAYIVQGAYPASLLASWDHFKAAQKPACDDQIRPSTLPSSQLYALILLSHAGTDLESWKVRNWREAKEIWEQVVEQLGAAEETHEFEHRDLHWGNILIAPSSSSSTTLPDQFATLQLTPRKSSLSPPSAPTIKATLIDFTLSRLLQPTTNTLTRSRSKGKAKAKPNVLYEDFEDECIFEGEGDRQFDVYRGMREIVESEGGGWEAFHPKTNLLWLHYLVDKLLHAKKLKTPSLLPSPSALAHSSPFASPSRSVPSPRKTRRQSLLITSLSSPSPIERKTRTLPTSSALFGKAKSLSERQRKDMVDEVAAWEVLIKAEEKLREVLGDLIEVERVVKKNVRKNTQKGKKVVRGGKQSKEVEREEEECLRGAADFAKWSRV